MITQKVLHTTIAILAAAASLSISTSVQARPTLCEERAMQWCRGTLSSDGINNIKPGDAEWFPCLSAATEHLVECILPPEGSGRICSIDGLFFEC
ncbi:hypothetical protein [Caulobacter segnis]